MKRALVRIALDPPAEGGNRLSLPPGSPSLLYKFRADAADEAIFGGRVHPEGDVRVEAGTEFVATLEFWAAEAVGSYLEEGARFFVCYPRERGHGVVLEVL